MAVRQDDSEVPSFCLQLSQWTRPYDSVLADALELMPRWAGFPPEQVATIISGIGLAPDTFEPWQGISPRVFFGACTSS